MFRVALVIVAVVMLGAGTRSESASVPFALIDNRIMVQARVNGEGPFTLLVDTGSNQTVVSPDIVRRLKLYAHASGFAAGAGSARAPMGTTHLRSLALGALEFDGVDPIVLDLSEIARNIGFVHLDGVIGYDLLRAYRVRVDMDARVLTLSGLALPAPAEAKTIPISLDDGLIRMQAAVDGVVGTFVVDTGDRSSLTLFSPFAAAEGFYTTEPAAHDALTGFGIGGPIHGDVFRTTLSIFDTTISGVITRASRQTGGAFTASADAGSIGDGLLKRFNVIYDYADRTLRVWPSRSFTYEDHFDPAGMWVSHGSSGPRVVALTPGGPAEAAGLRIGDVIAAVDGSNVQASSAITLRDWLTARPDGTTIAIQVRGSAAARTLVLHDATLASGSTVSTLPRHGLFGAAVIQGTSGLTVQRVIAGSAAASAGLAPGDVVERIDDRPTTSLPAFLRAIHVKHAGDRLILSIRRAGLLRTLQATLTAPPDEHDPRMRTEYGILSVDDSLRRTLETIPAAATTPRPAVLLIGGIGCYSVDDAGNQNDPYLRVMHDIGAHGFITLRLEKSGVGDSQGPPCHDVDFHAESRGYAAALDALKRDPRVDSKHIYLLGHSIGSLIAPRMADAGGVAGVIIAEAVGRDWPEYEVRTTRREHVLANDSPHAVDENLIQKAGCMQRLLFEGQSEAAIEAVEPDCKTHDDVYPVAAGYMREVAPLDIIGAWTKVTVPVLAVYGSSDFVTEREDHQRIIDVVNAAHPGFATLIVIDGMDHLLSLAPTAHDSYTSFTDGTPELYDPATGTAIVSWLLAREAHH